MGAAAMASRRGGDGRVVVQADSTFFGADFPLSLAVGILVSLGLVLVYSSSAAHAARSFGDGTYFLYAQLIRAGVGIGAIVLMQFVPMTWLRRKAGWLFVIAVLLCVAVLIPGLGVIRGGARRWLLLGPTVVQPSELAKLAVIMVLAAIFAQRDERRRDKDGSGLLAPVVLAQIPVLLVLMEPDLGTALVMELIIGVMVFIAGLRLRVLALLGLATLPVFYHLVMSTPFRLRRLLAFIDPWAYRQTVGYQLSEALISTGSGGVFGLGLGVGKHGLFYLPEAHTDFIFAILGQELGFVGVVVLMSAFAVVLWRGYRIAMAAPTVWAGYLAMGLTCLIGVPAVFNTCVVTGLLPTKGLPLPLVSYGGSNLIVTLVAVGILIRIDRDTRAGAGSRES